MITGGLCLELPVVVFDKYFFAEHQYQPFEYYTARAICGRCSVREACLRKAISDPGLIDEGQCLVRGGESSWTIRNLRRRHFLGGEDADELTEAVYEAQLSSFPHVGQFRHLREGRFGDAELACP